MRGPGQRAGLTRAAVLAAARSLLAEGGVDALLAAAGVADVPAARRVLIIHAIGFAAFDAGEVLPPGDTAGSFRRSLDWLLAGIAASRPASHHD